MIEALTVLFFLVMLFAAIFSLVRPRGDDVVRLEPPSASRAPRDGEL